MAKIVSRHCRDAGDQGEGTDGCFKGTSQEKALQTETPRAGWAPLPLAVCRAPSEGLPSILPLHPFPHGGQAL